MKTQLSLLFTLVAFASAGAHDLVLLLRSPGELVIKFGHPGEYEPADLHKLLELNAYPVGSEKPVSLLAEKPQHDDANWKLTALGGKPVGMVTGQYDNGYWVGISEDTYYNTSKLYLPEGKHSGEFFKFGKGLSPAVGNDYKRHVGQRLEIVPQSDPFSAKPGDKLAVQILWRGKPLPGAKVEIGDGKTKMREEDIPRYKSNAEEIAELPISEAGLHIIAIDYETESRARTLLTMTNTARRFASNPNRGASVC